MKDLFSRLLRRREAWTLVIALLLVAAALLQPRWERSGALHSFLMVIDITQSMNARDLRLDGLPASRLQAAKAAARQTILDLPCGSRVGLSLFSEHRTFILFAPVEVCANFTELTAALARIDGRMSWAGASEIAKGVGFALRTQQALPERPLVVFFTDGHEAPPLDPRFRTRFETVPGTLRGVFVGVGGERPVPIPKFGPDGEALGFWRVDEVMHDDPHNLGRGGSVKNEGMADESGRQNTITNKLSNEHLSSLREPYLRQLAQEAGLGYVRLQEPKQASIDLRALPPSKVARSRVAIDWLPASLALFVLLLTLLAPLSPNRRPRI
jgi:mxaL protein